MNILKKIGSYIIAFFLGIITLAGVFISVNPGKVKNDKEDEAREQKIDKIKNIKY